MEVKKLDMTNSRELHAELQLRLFPFRNDLDIMKWNPRKIPEKMKLSIALMIYSSITQKLETYLSLPKKRLFLPLSVLHPHPRRTENPWSSTFCVFDSSLSFHSCSLAAIKMSSTSWFVKRLVFFSVSARAWRRDVVVELPHAVEKSEPALF
jgi:hypothetical protein